MKRFSLVLGSVLSMVVVGCSAGTSSQTDFNGGSGASAGQDGGPGGASGGTAGSSSAGGGGAAGQGGSGGAPEGGAGGATAGAAGASGQAGTAGVAGSAGAGGQAGSAGAGGQAGSAGAGGQAGAAGTAGAGGSSTGPTPCTTNDDCSNGQICQVVVNKAGTALELRCEDPVGSNGLGSVCSNNGDCRSNLCIEGHCSVPCSSSGDCTQAGACQNQSVQVGSVSGAFQLCVIEDCPNTAACENGENCSAIREEGGTLHARCQSTLPNGAATGTSCTKNGECASALCVPNIGVCTEICSGDNDCSSGTNLVCVDTFAKNGSTIQTCAPSCKRRVDCSGNTCRADWDTVHDVTKFICGQPFGSDQTGADCTNQNNCATGLCLQNILNGTVIDTICTEPCVTNADCPQAFPKCIDVTLPTPSGNGNQTVRVCNHA